MLNPTEFSGEEGKTTETGIEKHRGEEAELPGVEETMAFLLPWEKFYKLSMVSKPFLNFLSLPLFVYFPLLIQFLLAMSFPGFE